MSPLAFFGLPCHESLNGYIYIFFASFHVFLMANKLKMKLKLVPSYLTKFLSITWFWKTEKVF